VKRAETLERLSDCVAEMRGRGVRALYLFGSTARDAATGASDVDLFIETEPASRFNAFDLLELKAELERRLEVDVDLATREGLHPLLRANIENDAIRVF
jgi:predicted nucleotidyltransferase